VISLATTRRTELLSLPIKNQDCKVKPSNNNQANIKQIFREMIIAPEYFKQTT